MNRQSRKVTSKHGKFINKMKDKVSSLKIIKMENMYELLMHISIRLNSYLIDRWYV